MPHRKKKARTTPTPTPPAPAVLRLLHQQFQADQARTMSPAERQRYAQAARHEYLQRPEQVRPTPRLAGDVSYLPAALQAQVLQGVISPDQARTAYAHSVPNLARVNAGGWNPNVDVDIGSAVLEDPHRPRDGQAAPDARVYKNVSTVRPEEVVARGFGGVPPGLDIEMLRRLKGGGAK